jgi:hypothetical protein
MSNVTRRALRVYAALSELRGPDSDVLDALIPFFEPIFVLMNGKVWNPHTFSAGVRKLYRWRFTGDIAASFVPRLERKGILRRQAKTVGNQAIWTVHYTDSKADVTPPAIVTAFEQIIDEFEKFPPRVTDLLSYKKSRDELKEILIRFLVLMDAQGQGAYARQLGDLEPSGEAGELVSKLEEGETGLDPNDRYMCARFVRHLMRRRQEFAPHLIRLSSIALLAEVVEDFLKPTHTENKTDLTVILDAPMALDFVGCSGKALKDDIVTVVNALRKIGVSFVVLPISCVEMQRNLRSMMGLPPEQRRGYTHNAMIRKEVSAEFVSAVANNPERALDNAGVTVRPLTLDSFPGAHRFFTAEHYEDFLGSVYWGNYVPAKEHDTTCVTLVMRLREGRHSSDVFKSRYVMVTRNGSFVSHARNYCLQNRMINETQEGPIIHARELATTAWLRTGLGADETIPRGHLIATCERVLQMRPEVRNALANHLAQVTPERLEQFNLLMQDARSVQKLADETLNNEEFVTAESAEHLLNVMREATAEELKEKHQAELEAERAAASSEISSLNEQVGRLRDAESRSLVLTENQVKNAVTAVNRSARNTEWVAAIVLLLLGAAGAVNMATGFFEGSPIWNVILILFGVASFVRLLFGLLERPMPGVATALNYYCRWSAKRRLKSLGLDSKLSRLEFKSGRAVLSDEPAVIEPPVLPRDITPMKRPELPLR